MKDRKISGAILFSALALILFFVLSFALVHHIQQKEDSYGYMEMLFGDTSVNEIDIQISEEDWTDMLENPLEEEYHVADVVINGETISNVAIRTKGNNSLTSVASSDSDRYSFKIDFDYYNDGENYYGLKKLNLNNNYGDSSYMREYISYKIMEAMGIPVPGCNYAHITINGEEWGLYLAVEAIDEVFLDRNFDDSTGDLYKPDGIGADLVYRSDDISEYTGLNLKTNEETSDGSAILALMKALESGEGLEDVLDVDEVLRYLAANVALANYDSYLGGTTHNYYLYEQDGVFTMLPWDYNYSFGGFGGGEVDIYEPANNTMGGGGGRGGQMEVPEDMELPENMELSEDMEQPNGGFGGDMELPEGMEMPGGFGGSNEKPLVTTLLAQEEFLAQYEFYLLEIAETYFTEAYMSELVGTTAERIAPYVEKDATAFFTYEEFLEASSTDSQDPNSLVYFAVNMADSILNQLSGGEPTFNSSSFAVSMGGGPGGGRDRGQAEENAASPQTAESMTQTADEAAAEEPPADGGRQAAFFEEDGGGMKMAGGQRGGGNPTQTDTAQAEPATDTQPSENQPAGTPAFNETTEEGTEENAAQDDGMARDKMGGRGGFGGMEFGGSRVSLEDVLPVILICGVIFVGGFGYLLYFRRRKKIKQVWGEGQHEETEAPKVDIEEEQKKNDGLS